MTPVRFGIVGYGFGARYFHAPLLVAAPECEVVGVMTSSADRQALVAREIPGAPTVTSLQALVEAGAEAVAISTPAETHSAVTDQALQLGLAVVCDKPFAMDPAAARRSVALAEERALMLSPYQNRRWDLDFRTVQKLVADGAFGTVTRFEFALRAIRAGARTGSFRRRHAPRLREPPRGPGAVAARTGCLGLRGIPHSRVSAWKTTSSSQSPMQTALVRSSGEAGVNLRPALATV